MMMGGMNDMMMMGMGSGGMGGDMMMMGSGWGMILGWVLLAALAIVGLVILFRLFCHGANNQATSGLANETPLAALQRRFVLGEINVDQFSAIKQQLATK